MQFIKFLIEYLKKPRQVGAVAASSPFLARKMAEQIDGATTVIEFGPGTGAITREILNRLPANGQLICFEINSYFCEYLKKHIKDPRLRVINDDVRNCDRYVDNLECIVSGLPLASFDRLTREDVLAVASRAQRYVQFQYTPFLLPMVKYYFRDVKVKFVLLNIPPAFVCVAKEPRYRPYNPQRHRKRRRLYFNLPERILQKMAGFLKLLC